MSPSKAASPATLRSLPLSPVILVVCAGCLGPDAEGRVDRHFSPSVWGGAVARQFERPEQYVPEGALLASTLLLIDEDRKLQKELAEDSSITEGSTNNGDAVMYGLTALSAGWAAGHWIAGDEGQSAEVLVESALLTEAFVGPLKIITQRERPLGGSNSSFPSGHASYSFGVATFLARSIDDSTDEWYGKLGYLAWLPAAYVGIDRVEANRHFPTDVAFGAFLGVTVTNIVYDAHHGDDHRRGVFGHAAAVGWQFEPQVLPDGFGVTLAYRF